MNVKVTLFVLLALCAYSAVSVCNYTALAATKNKIEAQLEMFAQTFTVQNATTISLVSSLVDELNVHNVECFNEINSISPSTSVVYSNRTIANTTACSSLFVDPKDACCSFSFVFNILTFF
jgi:uncharacterized membrane protein